MLLRDWSTQLGIYVRSPTQTTEMRIMYKLSLQFDTRWHDINIARRCNKHKFCVNCRQCTLRSRDVTNFACVLDPTQLLISPLYQKVIQCYIQSVKQEWTWWTTPVVDTSFTNFTCRSRRKFCVLTRRIFTLQILKQQMTSKSKVFFFLKLNRSTTAIPELPYFTFLAMSSFETNSRNNFY